ncbi:MAG: TetR/AcrR family transcriptional regulator [Clostridiales bacterium]|nr:TetR/AcrR family transcriptional regulator [Clostridiales bacterium]
MTKDSRDSYKRKLIEITCAMIDENNGYTNTNMRTVAKIAGCAHTNIYNYYSNYVELLYAAMKRSFEKVVLFTQERVGARAASVDHFPDFIDAQIEFSIQHQGLYRFIWLEDLPGAIPDEVKEFAMELKNRFALLVYKCAEGKLTSEEAAEISYILHSYLHGEICKMISARDVEVPISQGKEKIKQNVMKLMQIMFENAKLFL